LSVFVAKYCLIEAWELDGIKKLEFPHSQRLGRLNSADKDSFLEKEGSWKNCTDEVDTSNEALSENRPRLRR
jgi:hypothetical protein